MAQVHIYSLYMYNDTSSNPFGIHTLILCIRPCAANGTYILIIEGTTWWEWNESQCRRAYMVVVLPLTSSRCGCCSRFFWTKLWNIRAKKYAKSWELSGKDCGARINDWSVGTHVFRKIWCCGRRHSSKNAIVKQKQKENCSNHSR